MICLMLAIGVFIVYWPASNHEFLDYDDRDYVTANPHVQAGLTGGNIAWAFCSFYSYNWHPLTWLSHMLDTDLFGSSPCGPHLVNVALHAANAILVFLLLFTLTKAPWRPAFVAALFAFHPLHVESVAWIAERKDLLSALFGLSALLAYTRFVKTNSRRSYWLAVFLFALGLMSKPMIVTLPFVMLLLDYWPLQRFNKSTLRRIITEKIPFFLLTAASCVVTFLAQATSGAVAALDQIPLALRIENMFVSYALYLGKTIWPVHLAVPYPLPDAYPVGSVLLPIAAILLVSILVLFYRRKFPFLGVGWIWFLGMLVPVIGLIQVGTQAMADRYTYLPAIGLFLMFVWGGSEWLVKLHAPRFVVVLMVTAVIVACSARTRNQLSYWQNTETLFRHSLEVTTNNAVAYENLANNLADQGRYAEAVDDFQSALEINPHNGSVHNDLGTTLMMRGKLNEAEFHFRQAVQWNHADANAWMNLGVASALRGDYTNAVTYYEQSLTLAPGKPEAHNNLAYALAKLNRLDEARTHYETALQIWPDYPQAHFNLGCLLLQLGQRQKATTHLIEAVRLKPDYPAAKQRLRDLGVPPPSTP